MADTERQRAKAAILKKKLIGAQTILNTKRAELDNLLEAVEASKTQMVSTVRTAQNTIDRTGKDHESYYEIALEVLEGEELQAAIEMHGALDSLIEECRSLCEQVQEKISPEVENVEPRLTERPEPRPAELPKMKLPTFNGNIIQFEEFWEGFLTIHEDDRIREADKFRYLMGLLEGSPRDLLTGMAKTSANYQAAIAKIKERYGGKERTINAHFCALKALPKPENLDALKRYRDKFEMHHASLRSLGVDLYGCEGCQRSQATDIWDRLPVNIQEKLSNKIPETGWTLPTLKTAIDYEVQRVEAVKNQRSGDKAMPSNTKPEWKKPMPPWKGKDNIDHRPRSTLVGACPATPVQCEFCDGRHPAAACRQYRTREQRNERIYALARCYKCLKSGHLKPECPARNVTCRLCGKSGHHTAFCYETDFKPSTGTSAPEGSWRKEGQTKKVGYNGLVLSVDNREGSVALPTALVTLDTGKGNIQTRALIDQGAQQSFILKEIATGCEQVERRMMRIDGFRSQGEVERLDIVRVHVQGHNRPIDMLAAVVDELPERIIVEGEEGLERQLRSKGRHLADDCTVSCKIGLLIGADNYYKIVKPQVQVGGQVLIPSELGDLKSGPTGHTVTQANTVTILKIGVDTPKDIDCLWDLDAIGIHADEAHPDDQLALENFNSSIRYEDEAYVARLPWRAGHPPLPVNIGLAKGRLESNLKRLRKDEMGDSLEMYDKVIRDQEQQGFIERVDPRQEPDGERCHYLAHHAVKKESHTTPIRVVFDCSAKTSPELPSLNDCLYSGPAMVPELAKILMRFRIGPCAASADITKAFLMIGLDKRDRDATRFLWPKDVHDPNSQVETFRFKVILFGATCSQFILNATLDTHLERKREDDPELAETIKTSIYVDNLLVTTPDEKSLEHVYQGSKDLLSSAGLHLREWASNVPAIRETASTLEEADTRKEVPLLGLRWDTCEDSLSLAQREADDSNATKRKVLSRLAAQFDPLGLVTPITIKAKMLIKEMWNAKMDWDDVLPAQMQDEWSKLKAEMDLLCQLKVQRQIHSDGEIDLHAFVDASTKAYGAVVYGVQGGESNLIISKGRIAPSNQLSVPKLELTAATLGSRLLKYVKETLQGRLTIREVHLWSDSNVALGWIHATSPLEAYIQNRKLEIAKNVPEAKWHYIATGLNPADKITRGVDLRKLRSDEAWWHGPTTLREQTQWEVIQPPAGPKSITTLVIGTNDTPEKATKSILERTAERCGTLVKLIRVFGFVQRFINNIKANRERQEKVLDPDLSAQEYQTSRNNIVRILQKENFEEEHKYLSSEGEKGQAPPLVRTLRLRMRDDLIVCDSRLTHADIDVSAKYPVLLPSKHRVTTLIIEQVHQERQHIGVNSVMTSLRQQWWIPKARQRVKQTIRQCMRCKKERGAPYVAPPIPPLPAFRLALSRPFTVVGVDYGGPLLVRNKAKDKENESVEEKRYFALFTCAGTRAVHIEVVSDMSAEAFLRAFQRFCAKRSYPSLMLSDNGSNFVASAEILRGWEKDAAVKKHLNHRGCKWQFIPGRAPWFGGFWERMIGLTKKSLSKALGRSLVCDDVLRTVMSEIEAQINDRPLTTVSDNVDDLQPITPSLLMLGHRLDSVPVPVANPEEEGDPSFGATDSLTQRQKHTRRIKEHYHARWYREYLTELRRTADHSRQGRAPEIGEIVQIQDDGHRLMWRLGIISRLHTGSDGHVRSCSVKTSHGILSRPVKSLYPLELRIVDSDGEDAKGTTNNQPPATTEIISARRRTSEAEGDTSKEIDGLKRRDRGTRAAARQARERIAAQVDID